MFRNGNLGDSALLRALNGVIGIENSTAARTCFLSLSFFSFSSHARAEAVFF